LSKFDGVQSRQRQRRRRRRRRRLLFNVTTRRSIASTRNKIKEKT